MLRRHRRLVIFLLVADLLMISALVVIAAHPEEEEEGDDNDDPPLQQQQQQQLQWKWLPEAAHPCNIDRMTTSQVLEAFGPEGVPALHPNPLVVIANPNSNELTRQRVQENVIEDSFPSNFNVTLSSSNSFSEHRRTIPLRTYLEEMKYNNGITTPHQLSNESWYLFGETYGEEWKQLLSDYQLPPCQSCQPKYVALSFGIGNRGSGVQWHIHGPGFSEALVGRKHWILYPPFYQPPYFHHDQSTRNWLEYIYTNTTLLQQYAQEQLAAEHEQSTITDNDNLSMIHSILKHNRGRPFECTLEPGDMIYFPDRWHHATINCDPYTAFVSTFTSDFLYLQDQDNQKKRKTKATGSVFSSLDEL